MDLHLTGRTAVVTGASKGIGLAITRALVGERLRDGQADALAGAGDDGGAALQVKIHDHSPWVFSHDRHESATSLQP